jgi:hypothetical protein
MCAGAAERKGVRLSSRLLTVAHLVQKRRAHEPGPERQRQRPRQTDPDGCVDHLRRAAGGGIAMLLFDLRAFQRYWSDDLAAQAEIMAHVNAPALSFDDPDAAAPTWRCWACARRYVAAAVYGRRRVSPPTAPRPGRCSRRGRKPAGQRIEGGEWWCSATWSSMAKCSARSTCARATACSSAWPAMARSWARCCWFALVIAGLVASRLQAGSRVRSRR